jgi:hypothetical protein
MMGMKMACEKGKGNNLEQETDANRIISHSGHQ